MALLWRECVELAGDAGEAALDGLGCVVDVVSMDGGRVLITELRFSAKLVVMVSVLPPRACGSLDLILVALVRPRGALVPCGTRVDEFRFRLESVVPVLVLPLEDANDPEPVRLARASAREPAGLGAASLELGLDEFVLPRLFVPYVDTGLDVFEGLDGGGGIALRSASSMAFLGLASSTSSALLAASPSSPSTSLMASLPSPDAFRLNVGSKLLLLAVLFAPLSLIGSVVECSVGVYERSASAPRLSSQLPRHTSTMDMGRLLLPAAGRRAEGSLLGDAILDGSRQCRLRRVGHHPSIKMHSFQEFGHCCDPS